jgi:hypothetical protein
MTSENKKKNRPKNQNQLKSKNQPKLKFVSSQTLKLKKHLI